jgi:hypothetical protein
VKAEVALALRADGDIWQRDVEGLSKIHRAARFISPD